MTRHAGALLAAFACTPGCAHLVAAPVRAWPAPVTFTARQDHRNMMEQLGIEALWPGASGNENSPHHANYDEALADPYGALPDALRFPDGRKVATAGLNPGKVSAVIVDEPSGADMNGLAHGRRPGYPFYTTTDAAVLRTARYFDTVNFAPHITAPTLIAMGFIDTTAPPAGIWTVLNRIPAPKEAVPLIDSDHMNVTPDEQARWSQRSEELLAELAHGGTFVPNQALTRPATRRVR